MTTAASTSPPRLNLQEMPQLSTGPIEFDFIDPEVNREEVARLTAQQHRVVEHEGPFLLGQSVIDRQGEYFLINQTIGKLIYYTHYEVSEIDGLGTVANECILWRQAGGGYPNITRKVFKMLLDEYDAVVSDKRHSPDGRRFWIDRMSEAINEGLTVGLLSGDEFIVYQNDVTFDQWIRDVDGWGYGPEHRAKQFMITRHAFEAGDPDASA